MKRPLRPNVVAVFTNTQGEVLVCERSRQPGCWQLPQGGVEPGENEEQALRREVGEELGNAAFDILGVAARLVDYEFPQNTTIPLASQWRGQTQRWFHVRYRNTEGPDLGRSDGEFRAYAWTTVAAAIEGIIEWKKAAYMDGFRQLGLWP